MGMERETGKWVGEKDKSKKKKKSNSLGLNVRTGFAVCSPSPEL